MALYLGLIIIFLTTGYGFHVNETKKGKKFFCFFVATLLSIVACLRSQSVGADTMQFCGIFDSITRNGWSILNSYYSRIEIGFFTLSWLLSRMVPNSQILIFATGLISVSSICFFIYKNSRDVVLSTILFVGFQFFAFWLTAMRQVLAMSIVLLCIELFLRRKKWLLFIFGVLFAFLFHSSALVCLLFLPIYLFKNLKIQYTIYLLFIFILFVGMDLLLPVVANLSGYTIYIDSKFNQSNYFAAVIKAILVASGFIISTYFSKKYKKRFPFVSRLYSDDPLYLITFVSLGISLLTIQSTLFERVAYYFIIFLIILIPNAYCYSNSKEKTVFKIGTIFLSLMYCAIVLAFRPEWTRVVPYSFFFN